MDRPSRSKRPWRVRHFLNIERARTFATEEAARSWQHRCADTTNWYVEGPKEASQPRD